MNKALRVLSNQATELGLIPGVLAPNRRISLTVGLLLLGIVHQAGWLRLQLAKLV
jgi:hypothetical protein